MLTVDVLNRAQMSIQRGETLEAFIAYREIAEADIPELKEYWTGVSAEMNKPLPQGHVWDVSSDW